MVNRHVTVDGGPVVFGSLGMLGLDPSDPGEPAERGSGRDRRSEAAHAQILLVEDDRAIREVLGGILEEEGYAVTTADNGRQALERLQTGPAPDLIVLDLRMPIMDGWQFRAAQKTDPALAAIPVLAISADGSAKAEAIDAAEYLRKPLSTDALLGAIGRILVQAERQRLLGKLEEAERFAALRRLAASVGHEIKDPLAYVSMNLDLASVRVRRQLADEMSANGPLTALSMVLGECRVGLDRIRDVVKDLQQLSSKSQRPWEPFAIDTLMDESLAIARNYVQHRATVRREYGAVPNVVGDRSAIGQVLLNIVLNAAEALPEGRADANVISVKTYSDRETVTIEIGDTGAGIPPRVLPHIFDPFFTTKPIGEGTGLGLAVSFRIVADHSGRIDVESEVGRGSTFRVVLPLSGHGSRGN
jgi:two-component system, cell cycle sensor histidine kinase and response regulator CckA